MAYPHKILTCRRSRMHIFRKTSGLAGFPKGTRAFMTLLGQGTVLQEKLEMKLNFVLHSQKLLETWGGMETTFTELLG